MRFSIAKFSKEKAKEAVLNSSKIEGYGFRRNKNIEIRALKIASKLCP